MGVVSCLPEEFMKALCTDIVVQLHVCMCLHAYTQSMNIYLCMKSHVYARQSILVFIFVCACLC